MKFIRPEIIDVISKINGNFTYNNSYKLPGTKKFAIFDFFDYGGIKYKEKFINHFNGINYKDDVFFNVDEYNKFKTKVGGFFYDRNAFNIFFIMYKKAKSLNKYGIKRYLFRKYIESDELSEDKVEKLREVILDFYTNEEDINKYVLGNKDFVYKRYNDEELDVLYEMGLFIKDDDLEGEIFKNYNGFKLIDIILITNISTNNYIKKGEIFANDEIYKCFLYFYNNSKSFKKLETRKQLIGDFLEKKKIGVSSAIKHIGLLIDYVKSLDEILSTPYCNLLDDFKKLNELCIKDTEKVYKNKDAYLEDDRDEEFDKNDDVIYSEFELEFLSIFYNIDKIQGYTYYDNNQFMDSDYLSANEKKENKGIGISNLDYTNLYK